MSKGLLNGVVIGFWFWGGEVRGVMSGGAESAGTVEITEATFFVFVGPDDPAGAGDGDFASAKPSTTAPAGQTRLRDLQLAGQIAHPVFIGLQEMGIGHGIDSVADET